ILDIAEQFFGTASDPSQMPITKESFYKLQKLHPKTLVCETENGEPISWVVTLPTSKELADKFLRGEINERELLDMTKPQELYEALYLCAAFTIPEHRRKGYSIKMLKEVIDAIPHIEDVKLFAWPYSSEGKLLIEKLGYELGVKISLK
ncbi:MAG: hypothetical protein HQL27_08420, partial [Candidatus Omnitrophica bacterium]|nr:hypothetical protein [Candidatus Omnitrophota bacterium]